MHSLVCHATTLLLVAAVPCASAWCTSAVQRAVHKPSSSKTLNDDVASMVPAVNTTLARALRARATYNMPAPLNSTPAVVLGRWRAQKRKENFVPIKFHQVIFTSPAKLFPLKHPFSHESSSG